jgi:hypothetical protein
VFGGEIQTPLQRFKSVPPPFLVLFGLQALSAKHLALTQENSAHIRSSPPTPFALVAQFTARVASNHQVAGVSPAESAIYACVVKPE